MSLQYLYTNAHSILTVSYGVGNWGLIFLVCHTGVQFHPYEQGLGGGREPQTS